MDLQESGWQKPAIISLAAFIFITVTTPVGWLISYYLHHGKYNNIDNLGW